MILYKVYVLSASVKASARVNQNKPLLARGLNLTDEWPHCCRVRFINNTQNYHVSLDLMKITTCLLLGVRREHKVHIIMTLGEPSVWEIEGEWFGERVSRGSSKVWYCCVTCYSARLFHVLYSC